MLFITIIRRARLLTAIWPNPREDALARFPMIFGKVGFAHPVPEEAVAFGHTAEFTSFLVAVMLAVEDRYALSFRLTVFKAKKRVPALRG